MMLWFLYNVLFTVGFALMLPRFLMRMWKRGGYSKHFLQRLAVYEPYILKRLEENRRVWVHAVSVGEVYVALKFIDEMRTVRPDLAFVLTTTTSTGYKVAENRLNAKDVLLYFPADFPAVSRKALDRIKPLALILTEGELWPNIIRFSRRRGVPVVIINARISESSHRGYKLLGVFCRRILSDINLFLVQSDQDKARFLDLGARSDCVCVMGTAKYDVAQFDPDGEAKARMILQLAGMSPSDFIITGGSTWPGEESALLNVYKKLKPSFANLKLVLVPRHAERSSDVESEIRRSGLSYLRRTELGREQMASVAHPDVLLVNTTGELKSFYACASVIFVGKSLSQHGGQNIIEPALYAKPIVVGPNMENFLAVVADFLAARALIQVQDAAGLEVSLRSLLSNPAERESLGRRAGSVVNDKRGVAGRSAGLVLNLMTPGSGDGDHK